MQGGAAAGARFRGAFNQDSALTGHRTHHLAYMKPLVLAAVAHQAAAMRRSRPRSALLLLSLPTLSRRGLAAGPPPPSATGSSPILHELPAAPGPDPAYDTHVATTPFQKACIAGYAAVAAVRDPERGDMVAALGETTGLLALKRLRWLMAADPVGREILAARPDIKEETVRPEVLRLLPEGSFGRAYARFMDHHGYSPDERSPVRFVDDAELAFVIQRYRQVHDFWHVLCGLPPTVLGELALKWVELVQTGLPVAAFSGLFGPLALPAAERRLLRRTYIPWAIRTGAQARPLLNVWYERSFERPLEEMRRELRVTPAPPLK